MGDYDDYDEPRRASGSRVSVLLVGLVVGALAVTVLWLVLAGNPLSDDNEVTYQQITVSSVNLEKNTICWSEDPSRRDAGQVCAILALDRAQDPPMPGTNVTIGTVTLVPPDEDPSRYAVYVSKLRNGSDGGETTEPAVQPSD